MALENYQDKHVSYKVLAKNDLGSVERIIYARNMQTGIPKSTSYTTR